MTTVGAAALIGVRGLTKRYPGVVALKSVDFSAEAGEVHALVGANGAGKSTLMNLLAGVEPPDAGEILVDGKPVRFAEPAAAQACGIATVYQEFSLVPQLSVARNIFLGREPKGTFGLVDEARLVAEARALLERFGLKLDPNAEVSSLSVAEQQLVEIARALSVTDRILILDEPTAVLSLSEQQNLFAIIDRLRGQGLLILYVSHHLTEVLDIADRVTVLRDGERVATAESRTLSVDDLVGLMIGSSANDAPLASRSAPAVSGPAFSATYHSDKGTSALSIRPGEVVGLAGLVGAGRTTFAKALAGSGKRTARVELASDGTTYRLDSPRAAMRQGIVYLTEDRKRDGSFAVLDVVANTTASTLSRLSIGPFRNKAEERDRASDVLTRLKLVAGSTSMSVAGLSGGNQQKVLFGRALLTGPKLLVCDEPTRGIDVGAKAEIHAILHDLAREGVAVLVISSEIDELLAVSHRIVVMRDRRFVADLPASQTDESKILIAASSGREPERQTA